MRKYVWGFPGVGKSSLKLPGLNIVDADCRLFEFKNVAQEDLHTDRPQFYERDEAYPRNYLDFIQTVDADVVLVNCHIGLLESLDKEGLLLIYPSETLLPEYIQRYIERGDNPSFVSYMETEAPGMIDYIESTDYDKYKVQTSNTYLSDLFERNDFKMKVMTKKELAEQLQRAKDLDVIGFSEDGIKLECDFRFLNDASVYGISAVDLAEGVFDGKYELDIDQLQKVCSQREAEIEKERLFAERRGGLSREELADKIMQGIVNGALGIRYDQIAPYSHGYEVTFGGSGRIGATQDFKNRWECYGCDFFDVPGTIVSKIENDQQNGRVFGSDAKPLKIDELIQAIDDMESKQISSFVPEKSTNLERWGARGYGSRGSIASVNDVHVGKGLDGIVQHHYHGDFSSMTPSRQNDLVETLVFMKGFCLDYLNNLPGGRAAQEKVIDYLAKRGTDISTPEKLQEWIKVNPKKCGKEENRVVRPHFNEGHNLYAQAFCDFVELESFVNNFKGSFDELCHELGGDRYDDDVFRIDYGVISTDIVIYTDNTINVNDSNIGIWDASHEDFLGDSVSFKHIKETCHEIGFDIKELEAKALSKEKDGRLSLDEQIKAGVSQVKPIRPSDKTNIDKETIHDR